MSQPTLDRIKLVDIRENPVALRAVNRTSDKFRQLVDSIRSDGVINPINVRKKKTGKGGKEDGKQYEIIDGLHRFTGSLEAGLPDIPAQIFEMEDSDALAAQIIGNFHKVETRPAEYTRGMLRILSLNPTMTLADLSKMLSTTPQFIEQRLTLTKLDPRIAEVVDNGKITLSNAFSLAKLPAEEQPDWVERAMTQGAAEFGPAVNLRVKAIKEAVRQARDPTPAEWQPIPRIRSAKELKEEFELNSQGQSKVGAALVSKHQVTDPIRAFALALAWVLQMDPDSQADAKAREEARKAQETESKAKRDAEKKERLAKEAAEKQQLLIREAEEARQRLIQQGIDPKEVAARVGAKPNSDLQAAAIGSGLTNENGETLATATATA